MAKVSFCGNAYSSLPSHALLKAGDKCFLEEQTPASHATVGKSPIDRFVNCLNSKVELRVV